MTVLIILRLKFKLLPSSAAHISARRLNARVDINNMKNFEIFYSLLSFSWFGTLRFLPPCAFSAPFIKTTSVNGCFTLASEGRNTDEHIVPATSSAACWPYYRHLGLQHVLVINTQTFAVPLWLGGRLDGLSKELLLLSDLSRSHII